MPKKDIFHEVVKEALSKEGWFIMDEHFELKYGKTKYFVDLAADHLIYAAKDEDRILIEIKSFTGKSITHDYHEAIGQYRNYRLAAKLTKIDRVLYLAVPKDIYNDFFMEPFGQASIEEEDLKIIVFDPINKTIVTWIK